MNLCKSKLHTISFFVLMVLLNISNAYSQSSQKKTTPNFDDLYEKGVVYFNNDQYNLAIKYFQHADIIKPNQLDVSVYLGLCFKEVNLYASAISYFENAIEIKSSPQTYGNLGAIYGDIGLIDLVLLYLNKALKIKPDYTYSLNNKGSCFFEMGKYEEALEILKFASTNEPLLPQIFYYIGTIYKNMGESENAIIYFDKAIEGDPNLSEAIIDKITTLENLGNIPNNYKSLCNNVVKIESNTITKNSKNFRSLYIRASAYQLLGNKKQMIADLNNALAILNNLIPLYPQGSKLIQWRAQTYEMLGNKDLATQDYTKLQELLPGSPYAKRYFDKNL